eukprot:SAG11_NODE_2745_length_3018_cov_3.931141_3_plen_180_part_00
MSLSLDLKDETALISDLKNILKRFRRSDPAITSIQVTDAIAHVYTTVYQKKVSTSKFTALILNEGKNEDGSNDILSKFVYKALEYFYTMTDKFYFLGAVQKLLKFAPSKSGTSVSGDDFFNTLRRILEVFSFEVIKEGSFGSDSTQYRTNVIPGNRGLVIHDVAQRQKSVKRKIDELLT